MIQAPTSLGKSVLALAAIWPRMVQHPNNRKLTANKLLRKIVQEREKEENKCT